MRRIAVTALLVLMTTGAGAEFSVANPELLERLAPVEQATLKQHGLVDVRRDDHLDIVAIALAAVTIQHQADLGLGRNGLDEGLHGLLGDADLGLTADLAPHGTRGVEDEEDGLIAGRRDGCDYQYR